MARALRSHFPSPLAIRSQTQASQCPAKPAISLASCLNHDCKQLLQSVDADHLVCPLLVAKVILGQQKRGMPWRFSHYLAMWSFQISPKDLGQWDWSPGLKLTNQIILAMIFSYFFSCRWTLVCSTPKNLSWPFEAL